MGQQVIAMGSGTAREMLRHTLATLAYRSGKALRHAPASFPDFHVSSTSRTPQDILSHLGDLMDWALSIVQGKEEWKPKTEPMTWEDNTNRFFAALQKLDDFLASDQTLPVSCERLFQGAIADAFTHVGQIAMLRRVAGAPIRGENYSVADIVPGRVGAQQSAPKFEFD